MADLINFTLPSINEGTDEKTLKQIKNYLFQLTEQMKFYLNNVDSDNFTDAYNQHLSKMANAQTTNAQQLSVTQQTLKKFKEQLTASMQTSVDLITGNKGGYVVLHDSNKDTFPDEILIMNTSDIDTATKIWRWNQNGLMYNNGGYYNADAWNTTVAIDMEGHINANYIKAGTIQGINISGVYIKGSEITGGLITGARIEADNARLGKFHIDNGYVNPLDYNGGLYADYNGTTMHYRVFFQPAYYDPSGKTAADTWVISTQAYSEKDSDKRYKRTFAVYADGRVYMDKEVNMFDVVNIYGNLYLSSELQLSFASVSGTLPLYVNKNGYVTANSSSMRYKENIKYKLSEWLNPEKLYDLPVVQYNYKPEYEDMELVAGTQIGILAEDVEKYYPNALVMNGKGQAESWQDRILIPAILFLVQKQHKEIEQLKMQLTKGA